MMRSVRLACLYGVLVCTFLGAEVALPNLTLDIPMRDGVTLPADVYLPSTQATSLPCVLIRTPNGRQSHAAEYSALAQAGYAVVIQDMRSSLDKEGKAFPYVSDAWHGLQDGYDTVQWLAKHPITNGKIGTAGVSARGIAELMLAPSRPPNLICQHIGFAAASLYSGLFEGGQWQKDTAEGWLGLYAKHPSVLKFIGDHSTYDTFWKQFDSIPVADRVHVPAMHYGGWYDLFLNGTLGSFASRQESGGRGSRGQQKLVIGPWTHFWPTTQKLGDFEVPENGRVPPFDLSLRYWFDYHLKGERNGMEEMPAVTYYVMGPLDGSSSLGNVWRTADRWPVPAQQKSLYLGKDQKLVAAVPSGEDKRVYTYNPEDPVPTIGGRNLFLEAGPKDQRPIESRADVLVYTSEPLTEDLEVTGPIHAYIYFSTDQVDTDVVVRLTDVYPDGRSILITDGIRRLSACESWDEDEVAREVFVDLWSTSQVFAKGHRIRVSISSSNYPKFERSCNCSKEDEKAGKIAIAENTVFAGSATPSRIVLPVVCAKRL